MKYLIFDTGRPRKGLVVDPGFAVGIFRMLAARIGGKYVVPIKKDHFGAYRIA